MAVAEIEDFNPPYLHPAYEATVRRAPSKRLIEVPREWFHHPRGPVWGRVPVRPGDNDLTNQHAGRPIGQTITLSGRVLDSDGRGVPNTLIEIWQTNASGAYVDPADPGFMSLDPNFTGAGRTITDSDGRYHFRTIKPAAYPGELGALFRPAHIHTSLFGPLLGEPPDHAVLLRGRPAAGSRPDPAVDPRPARRRAPAGALQLRRDRGRRHRLRARLRLGHRPARAGRDADGERADCGEIAEPVADDRAAVRLRADVRGQPRGRRARQPGRGADRGAVLDGDGVPLSWPEGFIEVWEGEQWARARTDEEGLYSVVVRKPEPQATPDGSVAAPHLNVAVFARGLLKQVADARLLPRRGGRQRGRPGARAGPAGGPRAARRARATASICASTSTSRARTRRRSSPSDRGGLNGADGRVSVFCVGDVFPDVPDGLASFAPLTPAASPRPTSSSATARASTPTAQPRAEPQALLRRAARARRVPRRGRLRRDDARQQPHDRRRLRGPRRHDRAAAQPGHRHDRRGRGHRRGDAPAILERDGIRIAFLGFCTVYPVGYEARPDAARPRAAARAHLLRRPRPQLLGAGDRPGDRDRAVRRRPRPLPRDDRRRPRAGRLRRSSPRTGATRAGWRCSRTTSSSSPATPSTTAPTR